MYNNDYASPVVATYTMAAASVISAATLMRVAGPSGKKGRVVSVTFVSTTAVTVAASTVVVGSASTAALYASLAVPVAVQYSVANAPTLSNTDANLIPADTLVAIGSGGGATAGAGTLAVTIAWF